MSLLDDVKTAIGVAAPFLNLIPGVGPYIGFAVRVVSDIESTMAAKTGAEKKAQAMNDLADAVNIWNAAHGSNFNSSDMMNHMSQLIDAVVGLANDVKAFKHKS
jgi:hypothetical protein